MLPQSDKIWIRPSSIKTFLKNPYEWYQTHILKEYTAPKSYLTLGTAVHHGLNVGYEEFIKTGTLPNQQLVLEATSEEFLKLSATTQWTEEEDVNEFANLASRLTSAYHKEIMPTILPKYTEQYVEVKFDNNPYIAGVRGTIDLITQDDTLVDIKTAGMLSKSLQLKHELQLSVYSLLAKKAGMSIAGASIHEIVKPTSTLDTRTRIVKVDLQEEKADEILELLASRIADFYRAVNGEPILDPANLFHLQNSEYMYA
ncbi:PD-(D/E)XK nuclease family protein [Sulfurimonas sp. SAG-AH-194-C21]|nr:PD-(D/E)XK nuclease family protein [Sulfurimonas sp. SAG-AH-194-C21]MDF1882609.1 PD-(D/E)XK nuclease family protein [Sulfurimonas sp. SAG-AH-194-C21]